MSKFTFILVIAMSVSNTLVAQQLHSEKNAATNSSSSKVGFKLKSPSTPVAEKKPIARHLNTISINDQKAGADKNITSPDKNDEAAKISGIMKLDYDKMPADVQSKISDNKAQGKTLLVGVVKVFTVEIKSCITDADHKKTLLFLRSKKGFINSQFVSAGLVKIMVEPTFDSADLKEALTAGGIHFNFLNRSYFLKK